MNDAPLPTSLSPSRWPGYTIAVALLLLGVAILVGPAPPARSTTQVAAFTAVVAGVAWLLGTKFITTGCLAATLRWLSVNALVLGSMLVLVEIVGRGARIDLHSLGGKKQDPRLAFPPWAREPDKELDEVFFQHPGPMEWTGQPLKKVHQLKHGTLPVYDQEPVITVSYDADGFRNPLNMKDWDVAMVGDSYTELGYLPAEQMVSSVVAESTGLRVKNLGVCDVSLLTEARYLRHFGAAPGCKEAVLVFFEGNDVQDVIAECEALEAYKTTGVRPSRAIKPQYSFIGATLETLKGVLNKPKPQTFQNAWFQHADLELPVTMSNMLPLDPRTMTAKEHEALAFGVQAFADEAKAMKMKPMLVYVPVNNRVYHGMIRWTDDLPVEVREWQPNDLASHLQKLCTERGISFLDVTPALRAAAQAGRYVHNYILDTHVNAEGARIIGEAVAAKLKSAAVP